jgi:hypothetical protein
VLTDSSYALAVTVTSELRTHLNGWKQSAFKAKTNFFEKRVREYSKSGVGIDCANQTFALDASF